MKDMYVGTVVVFETSEGILKNKTFAIEKDTRTKIMKGVSDIFKEYSKVEGLHNIQVTIRKV